MDEKIPFGKCQKGFLSLFEKGVVRSLYVSIGKGLREL